MPMTRQITKKCEPFEQDRNCLKMEFLSQSNAEFFPFLHDYFHPLKTIENTLQSI